jgi:hypothetical protein
MPQIIMVQSGDRITLSACHVLETECVIPELLGLTTGIKVLTELEDNLTVTAVLSGRAEGRLLRDMRGLEASK